MVRTQTYVQRLPYLLERPWLYNLGQISGTVSLFEASTNAYHTTSSATSQVSAFDTKYHEIGFLLQKREF